MNPRATGPWLRGAAIAAVLLLGGSSCQDGAVDAARRPKMSQSKRIEFVSVGQGPLAWKPRAGDFGPQCVLFRSKAAWDSLAGAFALNPAARSADGVARLAKVDFTRESVMAVTIGEAGSTGISIRLDRIEAGPPPVLVMTGAYPGPTDMVGAMMTHPFHLVILGATSLPKEAVFTLDGKPVEVERHVFE